MVATLHFNDLFGVLAEITQGFAAANRLDALLFLDASVSAQIHFHEFFIIHFLHHHYSALCICVFFFTRSRQLLILAYSTR